VNCTTEGIDILPSEVAAVCTKETIFCLLSNDQLVQVLVEGLSIVVVEVWGCYSALETGLLLRTWSASLVTNDLMDHQILQDHFGDAIEGPHVDLAFELRVLRNPKEGILFLELESHI